MHKDKPTTHRENVHYNVYIYIIHMDINIPDILIFSTVNETRK